jgi:hypothetical protein
MIRFSTKYETAFKMIRFSTKHEKTLIGLLGE